MKPRYYMPAVIALALSLGACSSGQKQRDASVESEQKHEETASTGTETLGEMSSEQVGSEDIASDQPAVTEPGMEQGAEQGAVDQSMTATGSQIDEANRGISGEPATAGAEAQEHAPWQDEKLVNLLVLNRLHHLNQKEIAMSELARKKSKNTQVKNTARQIQSDHRQLDDKVRDFAKREKVELKSYSPSTYDKAVRDRLSKLSGQEFDRTFMDAMTLGHQLAIDSLAFMSGEARGMPVAALIDEALPHLKSHRVMTSRSQRRGVASEPAPSQPESQVQPGDQQLDELNQGQDESQNQQSY